MTSDGEEPGPEAAPLRVSTLELFFDLVFVFAITQLTGTLSYDVTVTDGVRVLLIFGALWWMYDGYVWLSNARTPTRTTERVLMLTGMAGFFIVALAIPHAFGRDGVALGIGYLILVVIHAVLYQRVNRNIARVAPFNLATAALIIGAGVVRGWAAYVLWAAALALLALSPLVVRVRGWFAMLLGVVALSAGAKEAIVNSGRTLPAGPCVALGCGVALFLSGTAAIRSALRTRGRAVPADRGGGVPGRLGGGDRAERGRGDGAAGRDRDHRAGAGAAGH